MEVTEGSVAEEDATLGWAAVNEPSDDNASMAETVERLFDAGKELAQAEIGWARARGLRVAGALRSIAILAAVALIVAFGIIVTLMLGAILALAPLIGIGLAILVVTGAGLVVIAICGLVIRSRISAMMDMPE